MVKLEIPKTAGVLIFMGILFAISQLFPVTLVLGKAGLLNPQVALELGIYSDLLAIFSVATLCLYFGNLAWRRNDDYGDNIGFFNKEQGFMKNYSYFQIFFLSLIFSVGFYLISQNLKLFGSGIFGLKIIPQQFSPVDILLVSTGQIPIAENLMFAFAVGLIVLIVTSIGLKSNWERSNYIIIRDVIIVIVSAFLGAVWHNTVYQNSTVALGTVAMFWAIGGLLSIRSGSFIPFWILHVVNNFFIDFSRLASSQIALGRAYIIFFGIIFIYGFIYRKNQNWLKGADR